MTEAEEQPAEPADEDTEFGDELVAEVAAHDEELAVAVGSLLERVSELEGELADAESELEATESELESTKERLEHTRADFQNYKKRAQRQQEEIKERATEDLIERLLDVRDNLTRALEEESGDVDSLREGVKLTRKQFDRVLDAENVERIEPEPGADVDATRHEVMMRVESEEPGGSIASVYRPGYEMAGKVLRAAQVTVAEDDPDGPETADQRDESEDGDRNGTPDDEKAAATENVEDETPEDADGDKPEGETDGDAEASTDP